MHCEYCKKTLAWHEEGIKNERVWTGRREVLIHFCDAQCQESFNEKED